MSLTNLCSCALTKDHKMRQIINDLYLLFIRIMNLASFLLAPPAEWQRSFFNANSSVVRCHHPFISQKRPDNFLAPPIEWQRSFSNADSSVVRRRRPSSSVVNFSIKSLISQKLSDNFFSFLAWSFLRKVLMYC